MELLKRIKILNKKVIKMNQNNKKNNKNLKIKKQ